MSRNLLGLLAALLLIVGGITAVAGPGGTSATGFAGGCVRVGLVLGAMWLALPQIQAAVTRMPGWIAGWFIGKAKSPDASEEKTPAVRERRPRRRSEM